MKSAALSWVCGVLLLSCGGDELAPLEDGWSFVVLPDTQIYARENPEILRAQMRWIAEQREQQRIQFVLHVGDVVDDNSDRQWADARGAFEELGDIPFAVSLGNHDYGRNGSADIRETGFDRALGDSPSIVDAARFDANRYDTAIHTFNTPDGPWSVLVTPFGIPEVELDWLIAEARELPGPAVLLSHQYLYDDGERYDRSRDDQMWGPNRYPISSAGEDAETLFQRLVMPTPAIRYVFCGHTLGNGVARNEFERADGTTVHEILANYQHRDEGGGGYLRLIHVDGETTTIRTVSPWLNSELTDPENQFTLE